jgi:hypothetical protein
MSEEAAADPEPWLGHASPGLYVLERPEARARSMRRAPGFVGRLYELVHSAGHDRAVDLTPPIHARSTRCHCTTHSLRNRRHPAACGAAPRCSCSWGYLGARCCPVLSPAIGFPDEPL